jgi:hypothetical protein
MGIPFAYALKGRVQPNVETWSVSNRLADSATQAEIDGAIAVVLGLFRLRLIERRLVETRIDLGEDIASLDVLAFGEQHLFKPGVDLRADADP